MALKEYSTITSGIKWIENVTQDTLVYNGKELKLETIEGQIFTHPDNIIVSGTKLEITNEIKRLSLNSIDSKEIIALNK